MSSSKLPYGPRKLIQAFNFFRWHVVLGLLIPPVAAGVFVACDTGTAVPYIDALYSAVLLYAHQYMWLISQSHKYHLRTCKLAVCTSALTLTGLTVTLLADMSFGQQFILYLLMQLGSIQFVSLLTLAIRRATFNKRFSDQKKYFPSMSDRKTRREDLEAAAEVLHDPEQMEGRGGSGQEEGEEDQNGNVIEGGHDNNNNPDGDSGNNKADGKQEKGKEDKEKQSEDSSSGGSSPSPAGRGGFPNPLSAIYSSGWNQLRQRYRSNADVKESSFSHYTDSSPGRSAGQANAQGGGEQETQGERRKKELKVKFGRNSDVQGKVNHEQHVMLAKLEISAMTFLIYTVLIYWIGIQLVAIIMWAPYFSAGHYAGTISENPNVSKTWFSVFQSASFLNNCGLTLVDTSLTGFQTCYIMLIPAVLMILAGNLGYPVGMRAVIWLYNYLLPPHSPQKQLTAFVLEHPRRIFFYLFPPFETLALVVVISILTSVDLVFFFILNIDYGGSSGVYGIFPRGARFINGLVQSVAVRSAGFYVVSLYNSAPANHILFLFMMIFAIYPLALAIRATNVYEEKALGISENRETNITQGLQHLKVEEGYIGIHLREQLSYDVWYILFAIFLVCIIERPQLENAATASFGTFSIFDVVFEVCSAYANVGLSIGSPSSNTSTSGSFRHLSKLVLCATMIRGRTRGLPVLVDAAVMTPRQREQHGDTPEHGSDQKQAQKEATSNP